MGGWVVGNGNRVCVSYVGCGMELGRPLAIN